MSSRTKIILGALGLFIVLGVGYILYTNSKNSTADVTVTQTGSAASNAEQVFINLSSELGSITFDTAIFSDPRFAALTDIHSPVLTESQGRHDPFATLGSQ